MEAYLINRRWMSNIEFTWLSPSFGYVVLVTGVVELFTAMLLFTTDAAKVDQRQSLVRVLACLLAFDALVMHFPFSEVDRNFGKEVDHVCTDLALIGGLYMLAGYRD